jgi:GTP-binding protein EngB required for normal cell division
MNAKAMWPRGAPKNVQAPRPVTELSAASVKDRAAALASALESGAGCLPAEGVDRAEAAIAKTAVRTSITGGRTVVAFAGATGSGKSSLFNVLAGTDFAQVGVRRPTTTKPAAAIWGSESPSDLLDWLRVGPRHIVDENPLDRTVSGTGPAGEPATSAHEPAKPADPTAKPDDPSAVPDDPTAESTGLVAKPDDPSAVPADRGATSPAVLPLTELDGLVLLDLPDFDSRANAHRIEADRVLDLVDVFIWVTDPQKYADARLHDEYIAKLSAHDAVTITVLNQADRLTPEALAACRTDLLRLLVADGVVDAEVIAVSARDGRGVDDLRRRINAIVRGRNAAFERLDADLRSAATTLRRSVAESEPSLDYFTDPGLVTALSRAAGIPVILEAVERDFCHETRVNTGWPVTRWVRALRPTPRKLFGRNKDDTGGSDAISKSDVRSVLGLSSLPAATPAARAAVALATRDLGARAGRELPQAWTDAVTEVAMPPGQDLGDALDQALVGTSLRGRDPFWWRIFGFVQWILVAIAAVGMSWLVLLTVLDWLRLPSLETPGLGPVPYPTLLFIGGLLVGYLVSLLTGAFGRVGGRRRKVLVAARLQESVAKVVDDRLVTPVQQVVDRHRLTREHLDIALKPA